MNLLTLNGITTAVAASVTNPIGLSERPPGISLQAKFTYGSGGTTVDAYVQSSVDNGVTWFDVANFHFTTAGGIKQMNISAATPVLAARTPTDGSLTANTAIDGVMGPIWRVKYATTGTYGGVTNLSIDIATVETGN